MVQSNALIRKNKWGLMLYCWSLSFMLADYFSSHKWCQADELEEGEIALSGDSHVDLQQSGSGIQDRDEGEDEQVLQSQDKTET